MAFRWFPLKTNQKGVRTHAQNHPKVLKPIPPGPSVIGPTKGTLFDNETNLENLKVKRSICFGQC